jgi:hypothetical protein
MLCISLFGLLYFFFWPLCCLFFDLRILITSLWYLQTVPKYKRQSQNWCNTQIYDTPNTQIYDTPNTQIYDTPSTQIYDTRNTQIYDTPNTQIYDTPNTQIYDTPNTQIYDHLFGLVDAKEAGLNWQHRAHKAKKNTIQYVLDTTMGKQTMCRKCMYILITSWYIYIFAHESCLTQPLFIEVLIYQTFHWSTYIPNV